MSLTFLCSHPSVPSQDRSRVDNEAEWTHKHTDGRKRPYGNEQDRLKLFLLTWYNPNSTHTAVLLIHTQCGAIQRWLEFHHEKKKKSGESCRCFTVNLDDERNDRGILSQSGSHSSGGSRDSPEGSRTMLERAGTQSFTATVTLLAATIYYRVALHFLPSGKTSVGPEFRTQNRVPVRQQKITRPITYL